MSTYNEAVLSIHGWTIECEHPFELRHEDGSFATGQAATLVIQSVTQSRYQKLDSFQRMAQSTAHLKDLSEMVDTWVSRVIKAKSTQSEADTEMQWQTLYDMVFTDAVNGQVHKLASTLGVSFEWDDPDGSYEDNVLAYNRALKQFIEVLNGFID